MVLSTDKIKPPAIKMTETPGKGKLRHLSLLFNAKNDVLLNSHYNIDTLSNIFVTRM